MKDGSNKPKPESLVESIEMPFVTDHEQVVKNAWYMLACRHLRPEIWVRKVSVDGFLIGIGSLVEIQDDTILVGIGEGAVITGLVNDGSSITEIQTDGEFEIYDLNKLYGIKIMQHDGISSGKVRTLKVSIDEAGIHNTFKVSIPLNDKPIPSKGDIVAFGEYEKITTQAICFGKKSNGDGTFDLTLIPYQKEIYTTDSGQIPEYQHNITPPQSLSPLTQIPPAPVTMPEVIENVTNLHLTGYPAVIHEVVPSVQMIIRESDGTLSPNTISCSQVMISGNELPVPSNKLLQYKTSKSDVYYLYTNPVETGDWDWIEFLLSDGGIELDSQRVPVLREGSDSVFLDIENQNYPIFCDHEGVPKDDQLPFSVQARLFRGIKSVDDVVWGLYKAPRGITINHKGLITVNQEFKYTNEIVRYPNSKTADPMGAPFYPFGGKWSTGRTELGMITEIEVRAYYQDVVLTRNFRIRKILNGAPGKQGEQGDPSPRYMGKSYTIDNQGFNAGIVMITDNPIEPRQVQAYNGDYFLYLGATITDSIYEKGMCIKWYADPGNSRWEQIPIDVDGDFESNPYMQSMADSLQGSPTGRFLNLIVGNLVARTAMIEKLFAETMILKNPGILKSENYKEDTSGFLVRSGAVNGVQSEFTDIKTKNMKVTGNLEANVSMWGATDYSLPLYGGVRAYVIMSVYNNNIISINISPDISVTLAGQGRFAVKGVGLPFLGTATVVDGQYNFYYGSISEILPAIGPYGAAGRIFEVRDASGVLRNLNTVMIYFIG